MHPQCAGKGRGRNGGIDLPATSINVISPEHDVTATINKPAVSLALRLHPLLLAFCTLFLLGSVDAQLSTYPIATVLAAATPSVPPPTTGTAGHTQIPKGAVAAKVLRVVDGDTIDVLLNNKETRIRYIGINTPETKRPGTPVEYFGKEADQANRQLVEGKTVYLMFDVERQDKYGRTLAYVWLAPAVFVNAWLVEQGYAQAATYPPNVRYADLFVRLQSEARLANRGLWAKSASPAAPSATGTGVIIQTVDLEGESVVLVNTGKAKVDLSGWQLVSEVGGQSYRIPQGTVLPPGGSLCIVSGATTNQGGKLATATLVWTKSSVWNNDGDPAALYNAEGKLVARFN